MVKIRLARQGSGHNNFFRIVAIDEKAKTSGQALDMIGYWQPSKKLVEIDKKKVANWVKRGAVVTKAVENLIAN